MGRAGALLCLLVHANACSFLFVRPAPPQAMPGQPVDCTDSTIFPWIDLIYGAAAVSSVIGGSASSSTSSDAKSVGVPIMSVFAIGLVASSYIGFRRTTRCGELKDAVTPQPYAYPPPQPYAYPPPQPYPPQPSPPQPYPPQPPPSPQPAPQP